VIERAQELSVVLRIVEIDFHISSSLIIRNILQAVLCTKAKILAPEISFETEGDLWRLTQNSTSPLFAGYRQSEARLHNQTKNVKISLSAAGGALRSYLGSRGENL
jgi:hypothetical protein